MAGLVLGACVLAGAEAEALLWAVPKRGQWRWRVCGCGLGFAGWGLCWDGVGYLARCLYH